MLEQVGIRSQKRRRGHGVRGTGTWDTAMLRARGQAEQYAKALPEWPPFLIVIDVGHSIETYADFTGTGKHYAQFPDTNSFRDLTGRSRNVMVIDLFGLTEIEVRQRFPEVYQWVQERVKPEREQNNRASYRDLWWVFGEPRSELRPALAHLDRSIVTVETAKHRIFFFC